MVKEEIVDYVRNFIVPGFKFTFSENRYISFKNVTNNKVKSLGVMDVEEGISRGFATYVQFLKFEKLCFEVKNVNDTYFPTSVSPYKQSKVIDYDFKGNVISPIKISTTKDLDLIYELLLNYVKNDAALFFNYWHDIRMFLPFIESDSQKSVAFLGNNFTLRKMVIWRLCSHPRYEEFVNKRMDILQRGILREKENDNYVYHLNEVEQKYKLLSSIDSEYEWDEEYLTLKPFGIDFS